MPKVPIGTMKKMKIAYNSAYIQIEAFNFAFTQQAIIVYIFVPPSNKSLCRTLNIKVQAYYFLPISYSR